MTKEWKVLFVRDRDQPNRYTHEEIIKADFYQTIDGFVHFKVQDENARYKCKIQFSVYEDYKEVISYKTVKSINRDYVLSIEPYGSFKQRGELT